MNSTLHWRGLRIESADKRNRLRSRKNLCDALAGDPPDCDKGFADERGYLPHESDSHDRLRIELAACREYGSESDVVHVWAVLGVDRLLYRVGRKADHRVFAQHGACLCGRLIVLPQMHTAPGGMRDKVHVIIEDKHGVGAVEDMAYRASFREDGLRASLLVPVLQKSDTSGSKSVCCLDQVETAPRERLRIENGVDRRQGTKTHRG